MKQRHRRLEMERLLARRDRQGLTFRELSEETGIPIPTLSYWASKLRREEKSSEVEFVPVEVAEEEGGVISIETAGGLRLKVEPGFDEGHLMRILSVLESWC